MFNTLFNNYAEQSKAFFAPVVKFNETVTAQVEKLAKLQIATFNEYADLGLKQFKDAVAVKDLDGFQAYANAQFQGLAKLNQKLLDDGKKFADLGASFKDELTKLAEENKNVYFAAPVVPTAKAAK